MNLINPKIAIVIPFFGAWPSYFQLFLNTCKHNKEIDVLFFTDLKHDFTFTENVKFYKLSLSDMSKLSTKQLGIEIDIKTPYKLCDFKPAYGKIFEEYLKKYHFWGFGDIDLFYGDIWKFISNHLHHDIISFRENWISGSFCLFRNTNEVNNLFRKSKTWEANFKQNTYLGFDECHFHWGIVRGDKNILDHDEDQSFTYLVQNEKKNQTLKVAFLNTIKEYINKKECVKISPKSVIEIYQNKEFMIYHLISEKKRYYFQFPTWQNAISEFYIADTGFYLKHELENRYTLIKSIRKIKGWFKKINFKFKRLIEILFK